MKAAKRKKLEADGWKVGSAADFLGLTEAEEALVAMKLALARNLKELRRKQGLTQLQLGDQIGSSQSRIAKMEAAERSVSLDLLVRSLLSLGASRQDIGSIVGASTVKKATTHSTRRKLVKN